MIRNERFLAFREKFGDPILTGLTIFLAVLLFALVPIQATIGFAFTPLGVLVVAVMAAGVYVLSARWIVLIPIAVAVVMHFTLKLVREQQGALHPHIYLIASLWLTLSLTFALVVARAVFAKGPVTIHRIIGAVLLYMLIALIFVALYLFIGETFPGAFENLVIADSPRLGADTIYFSFTTLTSVGFGDMFPIHPIARSLCNLESICGQLFPAILIARLVSLHIEQAK
ncbi:ion channel [Rhodoblastus sp. 17X3]|uniref:ion channel n=1 Tax=Rhodoblastus sp. 17X3 TaxID=3047026 RepID=UPI0024B7B236|nr:ion channel [Rhodoblastus sp. 17X3]MDI9847528.1 ion channel [Rhodoblastus sp. 17X3]